VWPRRARIVIPVSSSADELEFSSSVDSAILLADGVTICRFAISMLKFVFQLQWKASDHFAMIRQIYGTD